MAKRTKQITAETDDGTLFDLFRKRGDEAAFELLVSRHSTSLMRFIRGMLGRDSAYADDAYQDTWIKAIDNSGKWKGGSFKAWLTAIARNTVIDIFRRTKPTLSLDAENELGVAFVENIPDAGQIPGEALAGEEAERFVAEKVMALPEAQREVFLMRVEQDMTFKEIAETLEIPLNTALGRMHYATRKLRAVLSEKLEERNLPETGE